MTDKPTPTVSHDLPILIVGGGLAGLFTALKLAPTPCIVLSPKPLGEGASSAWAQGGIAAALAEGDSPESHTRDTVAAGAGLVDEAVTLGMAQEARARVTDLLSYGVPFDRDLEGHLVQSREAAHSARRIVRVAGDKAGKAIMEALVAAVRQTPSVAVHEGVIVEDLIVHDNRVVGVWWRHLGEHARSHPMKAKAVVLATGGIGALYAVTTNPAEARGIGLAIAANAGAKIADPEFVQFHPTAIDIDRDPAPLATEALRGDGARLIDKNGDRFMVSIHPDAELAPRDIVARGVFQSIASGRGAFLDAREAIGASFPERFPTVYAACREAGIDPVDAPVPVAPAEHYHMGGIMTDARGRSSVAGLWAAGEVASTGVHGANRLASNSLLEAVVFGARIADDLRDLPEAPFVDIEFDQTRDHESNDPRDRVAFARLRGVMQAHCGVIRDERGLTTAVHRLAAIRREARGPTLRNMATTALIVAVAALLRQESRGGHWRSDHPDAQERLAQRTVLTLAEVEAVVARLAEAGRAAVRHVASAARQPAIRSPILH